METRAPSEPAAAPATAGRRAAGVRAWLAHPLLLLLVGALITSVLVPSFERQSQRHEHELQIRADVAERITQAINPFLAATRSNEFTPQRLTTGAYDAAYEQWTTKSNEVLTQLRTYFPRAAVANDWQDLQTATQWLYYLFKAKPPTAERYRAGYLSLHIRPYLRPYETLDISYPALAKLDFRGAQPGDLTDSALRRLLEGYRLSAEAIIDKVFSATPRT